MKKQLPLFLLSFLVLLSCKKNEFENKKLYLGPFSMVVPVTWSSISRQGYDSRVGLLTDGENEIFYDYGWFSYNLNKETSATHNRIVTTIDGKPALLVQPKQRGKGLIGLYINLDDQNKLTLYGQDIEDEVMVRKIFTSLKF